MPWFFFLNCQVYIYIYFLKKLSDTFMCLILGPLLCLFWISGDVSSGFQSQSGFCLIHGGECNVHFPRSTSGATHCRPLAKQHCRALTGLISYTRILLCGSSESQTQDQQIMCAASYPIGHASRSLIILLSIYLCKLMNTGQKYSYFLILYFIIMSERAQDNCITNQ